MLITLLSRFVEVAQRGVGVVSLNLYPVAVSAPGGSPVGSGASSPSLSLVPPVVDSLPTCQAADLRFTSGRVAGFAEASSPSTKTT